jgi:DNA-binding transcriptional regulator YdaS (Cro superfamily)
MAPRSGATMPGRRLSATGWVQLAQALIARELVVSFGLPERQAAELLGIAPSAVSQYLSGKRLGASTGATRAPARERSIARLAAQRIAAPSGGPTESVDVVFGAARELAQASSSPAASGTAADEPPADPRRDREVRRYLRRRIALEQDAVGECMRLAQRSRDELTRAVFRQIASDSLRHAEIVASIQTYLERGLHRSYASGVRRADIARLIEREREAEAGLDGSFGPEFGGMIHVLWESMEADERKHEALLEAMLLHGLPPEEAAPPRGRSRPGRTR